MNDFPTRAATSIWGLDRLFIELLQICDLQLIVVVHWLLERILRNYMIFIAVVFYLYEPAHRPANLSVSLLFLTGRILSLISSGRISRLKFLTFYFHRKALYVLVKWLVKHDILTNSEFFIFSFLSSGFRLC